jgi:hypothetical protein
VTAFGEEAGEPRRRLGNGIRPGDADDVEAGRARIGEERRLQKSRLA